MKASVPDIVKSLQTMGFLAVALAGVFLSGTFVIESILPWRFFYLRYWHYPAIRIQQGYYPARGNSGQSRIC